MNDRSRGWCFTLNNYTDEEFNAIKEISCRYLIVGEELGEQGTPHLQGFIYHENKKSFKQVKQSIPRAHLEIQKGSSFSNQEYCSKEGKVFSKGELPLLNPAARAAKGGEVEKDRWVVAKELAKSGRLDELDPEIYWRYYRTAKEIARDNMPKKDDAQDVTGIWIHGPAGVGKSKLAREMASGEFYPKLANKWWDGYQDQSFVVMDDVGKKHDVLGYHLKLWSDRYSFIGETKGGAIMCRPAHFIVTSQYTIEEIWAEEPETIEALNRRFTVHNLTK